jgi:hypothetical protein
LQEGKRLFDEFWRTADDKHLFALINHLRAMRSYRRRPR